MVWHTTVCILKIQAGMLKRQPGNNEFSGVEKKVFILELGAVGVHK